MTSPEAPGQDALASIPKRAAARIIDFVFVGVVAFALSAPTSTVDDDAVDVPTWVILVVTGFFLAYETGFVAWRGATPGKAVMRLRIVDRPSGHTPAPVMALIRAAIVAALLVTFGPLSLFVVAIVYFSAAFDRHEYRGLLDRAARTVVVDDAAE